MAPNNQKFYLTREGLDKLKKEHVALTTLRDSKTREEWPEFLHSEELNPVYASFQEDITFLDRRINELEVILKNYEPIKIPPKAKQNIVGMGATVLVEMDGQLDEFTIVGTLESNPSTNKISNESPVGKAILGKKVGDVVEVKTPIVNHKCKIIKIRY